MKCVDKCNKVDFREYIYGVIMASPKSVEATLGKVTRLEPIVCRMSEKSLVEVGAWAGKLSTQ